jgi:hypothetical protein
MSHPPTSFRFSPEELDLLDAIGAHLTRTGPKHTRIDTVRVLLRRTRPDRTDQTWVDAYEAVFGPIPPSSTT